MTKFAHVAQLRVRPSLVSSAALVLVLGLGLTSASAVADTLPCRDGGPDCIDIGFTDAWFEGQTVQLEYSHRFFCAEPPDSGAASGCEAGEAAITPPPSGPVVSEVYLLIPVGFSPPASTLHCPFNGRCIDHPSRMDLSALFGPTAANAVLPAHSFVIEDLEEFQSTWWPVVLVGVKDLATWNRLALAKNIASVDACQEAGHCMPEAETNAFLFFQVLGPGMSPEGPD